MTLLQSIFLGALQGVAEFLPISSSGHLVVFRHFMSLGEVPILFDIMLHLATLLVVVIVFRKAIMDLLNSLWKFISRKADDEDRLNMKIIGVILGASVFTAGIGIVIESFDVAHKPRLVSLLFLATAAVMLMTKFIKAEDSGYQKIGVKTAVVTGIAQGIAVLPGISRSGMTLSSSLFSGIGKDKAGEYSFLLSIPAIVGAIILESRNLGDLGAAVTPLVMIAGMVSAFVVGLVSILFLLNLIKKSRLYLFAFYLIPFGIFSFIVL